MVEKLQPFIEPRATVRDTSAFLPPQSEDGQFRTSLFREAVTNLPVVVYINEKTKCYHIKDGKLQILWADDLPDGGSAELVRDLSRVITPQDRSVLVSMFEMRERLGAHNLRKGRDLNGRYTICEDVWLDCGGSVEIGIRFEYGAKGKVYELAIERAERKVCELPTQNKRIRGVRSH